MSTAINFNWIIKEKTTSGKVYDFTFQSYDGNAFEMQFEQDGQNAIIRMSDGTGRVNVPIFRDKMRVKDAIAIGLKRAGIATSGAVYKCEILTAISGEYETNEIYSDIHSPSHDFATNKPVRETAYFIGFELETTGRNNSCETALHNLRSNIWRQVSDASISGPASGIEFVTTLLHPNDAIRPDFYESFFDMLTGLAVSGTLSSTGLHCHISRTAFGTTEQEQDENIAKLIYVENFLLSDRALTKLYGRDGSSRWCRPNESYTGILDHVSALAQYDRTIINNTGIRTALQADLLHGNKSRRGHNYPEERYHRINITNQHTIEFRQGKGMIKSTALANIAQHAVTLAKYVRETNWNKLSADGYYKSIPTSAKYAELKRIFSTNNTDE